MYKKDSSSFDNKNPKDHNNSLVTHLTNKLNITKTTLQTRIRARELLSTVDKISSRDFNKLIQISKRRCYNIKLGHKLNHELNLSSRQYDSIADQLCLKQMYFEEDIKSDRDKLKQLLKANEHHEIDSLFKVLKDNIKREKYPHMNEDYDRNNKSFIATNTTKQNMIRTKLGKRSLSIKEGDASIDKTGPRNDIVEAVIGESTVDPNAVMVGEDGKKNTEDIEIAYAYGDRSGNNYEDITKPPVRKGTMVKAYSQDNIIQQAKYRMNELLQSERNKINDSIVSYLDMTNGLKYSDEYANIKTSSTHLKKKQKKHTTHSNDSETNYKRELRDNCLDMTKSLQYLNYSNITNRAIDQDPKEEIEIKDKSIDLKQDEFDIKKLIRYTSIGKLPTMAPLVQNVLTPEELELSHRVSVDQSKGLLSSTIELNQSLILDKLRTTLYRSSRNDKNADTINTVKKELAFDLNMHSTFKNRSDKLNNCLSDRTHNDNIYLSKTIPYNPSPNIERIRKQPSQNNLRKESKSIKPITTPSTDSLNINSKFANSMQSIFQQKQNDWGIQDKNTAETNEMLRQNENFKKEFRMKLDKTPRQPIKYIDGYSVRDGRLNNYNKVISNVLGRRMHSKHQMNNRIGSFYVQYQENEENMDRQLAEKLKEEREKLTIINNSIRKSCDFTKEDLIKKEIDPYENIDLKNVYLDSVIRKKFDDCPKYFDEYLSFMQSTKEKESNQKKHDQMIEDHILNKNY